MDKDEWKVTRNNTKPDVISVSPEQKKRYNKPGLTLREIRAKKSPCEGWLRFIVGQKRISCRLVIFFTCHLRKCRYRVYWNLLYPYVFLKWFSWKIIHYGWKKPGIIINSLMVASIMQKQKKEKLQNKQWRHWKGDGIHHCVWGNVDWTFCLKLLSTKQTFDFFFPDFYEIKSYFSYPMFIYAMVGNSKFVEMHVQCV